MKEILEDKLKQAFAPSQLEVQNLSHLHQGHEHVGANSHFHIVMVSQKFEGKNRVERYRMVHQTLAKEITESLHAISCNLKSPQEASASDAKPSSAKSSVATANMPPDASTDSSGSVGSANSSGTSDSKPSGKTGAGSSDSDSSAGSSDSDPSAGSSDSDPSAGSSDSDPSAGSSDSKPSGKAGGGSTAKGGAGDEI